MARVIKHGQLPPDHPIYKSGAVVSVGGFRLPPVRYYGEPGATGFWVHGTEVWEVEVSHIRTVMNHPQRFGLEAGEVEERYRLHREKPGTEGRARREIITELCGRGWIRIRHHPGKQDYWCVSWVPDGRWRIHLQRFLRFARSKLGMAGEADLKIEDLTTGHDEWYRFADGGVGAYLAGREASRH